MADVFISYSTQDQKFADFVHQHLVAHDINVFMASISIKPGKKWDDDILSNLQHAQWVLFLASKSACQSPSVQQELGFALRCSSLIIPIVWEMDPKELPGWTNRIEALDLRTDREEKLAAQCEVIAKQLKISRTTNVPKLPAEQGLFLTADVEEIPSEYVPAIQRFVSRVNYLLDLEYNCVKRRLFPDVWQIGFAFHSFKNGWVCYSLYAVPNGQIDLPAKYVPIYDKSTGVAHGFQTVYGGKVLELPEESAEKFVHERMAEMVKARNLFCGSKALYLEQFFQFIQRYHFCLGLAKKADYSLDEIRSGLCDFLLCWMHVAMGRFDAMVKLQGSSYVGPVSADLLIRSVYAPDKESFLRETDLLRQSKRPLQLDKINRVKLNTQSVGELLVAYRETPGATVKLPYPPPDYGLVADRIFFSKWEPFSTEAAFQRAKCVLEAFPKAYTDLLTANGFCINDFRSSTACTKFVCFYDHCQNSAGPGLEMFLLDVNEGTERLPEMAVYPSSVIETMWPSSDKANLFIQGRPFPIRSWKSSVADFFFDDTPLEHLVYQMLNDDLRDQKRSSAIPREEGKQASRRFARQTEVRSKLYEVHSEIGRLYESAGRVLDDHHNPARGYLAAHALREVMGRLPEYLRGIKLKGLRVSEWVN